MNDIFAHFRLDEKETNAFPANLVDLGDSVLINSAAPRTIEELKSHGVKVTPTAAPITANISEGSGSIRCFMNELKRRKES